MLNVSLEDHITKAGIVCVDTCSICSICSKSWQSLTTWTQLEAGRAGMRIMVDMWLPCQKNGWRTLLCPCPGMRWQSSVRKTKFLSTQRNENRALGCECSFLFRRLKSVLLWHEASCLLIVENSASSPEAETALLLRKPALGFLLFLSFCYQNFSLLCRRAMHFVKLQNNHLKALYSIEHAP